MDKGLKAKWTETSLEDARRIAAQPVEDRLDGKQGEAAKEVAIRLLEAAGLDYIQAVRLMGAVEWGRWSEGWNAGYRSGRGEED